MNQARESLITSATELGAVKDELAQEKKSRVSESQELRRQVKDLTESSEQETRQKNEKIKRLQEESEELRRQQNDRMS